jgi:hypothetical protein
MNNENQKIINLSVRIVPSLPIPWNFSPNKNLSICIEKFPTPAGIIIGKLFYDNPFCESTYAIKIKHWVFSLEKMIYPNSSFSQQDEYHIGAFVGNSYLFFHSFEQKDKVLATFFEYIMHHFLPILHPRLFMAGKKIIWSFNESGISIKYN